MENVQPVGHDWHRMERRVATNHLVLFICSKCHSQHRTDAQAPSPDLKLVVYKPNDFVRMNPMSCEEVVAWNIHNQ
jgi:hypothetical protein